MAVLALPSQPTPKKSYAWSAKGLLEEVKRYLYRYGTATDVETDPIELLAETAQLLSTQESAFENEHAEDSVEIERLQDENAKLRAELAEAKAKLPPWWKG